MVEFMEWRPMGDKVKVSPGWHQACFSGEFDMWRQDDVSWAPRVEREGFAKGLGGGWTGQRGGRE